MCVDSAWCRLFALLDRGETQELHDRCGHCDCVCCQMRAHGTARAHGGEAHSQVAKTKCLTKSQQLEITYIR